MEIRTATEDDLLRIMELGKESGHLMLYQKDPDIMRQCLLRILVAEEDTSGAPVGYEPDMQVVGYYHYIVSSDPGFEEMLRCYRQFPEELIKIARERPGLSPWDGPLCICMQGASHREVFEEFIKYLQKRYNAIWCYCSVKSRRPETYRQLGFTFSPEERYPFWNTNKGDDSTYQLGRWVMPPQTAGLETILRGVLERQRKGE